METCFGEISYPDPAFQFGSRSGYRVWSLKFVDMYRWKKFNILYSVPDPGSGAFLTPGSGIRNRFFPDPVSQSHIFESLVTIFWVKSSILLWKLAQIFCLQHFETKIIFNLWNLWLFSPLSFVAVFLDPGTEIRDPGWVKSGSGIRDKHPGSATLILYIKNCYLLIPRPP